MSFKSAWKCLVLFILWACLLTYIFPFQTTSVSIRITDPNNDGVSGAEIWLQGEFGDSRKYLSDRNGKVVFETAPGNYLLLVKTIAFKPYRKIVKVRFGENELNVALKLVTIVEKVEIERNERVKATEDVFSNFLTKEQLEALPEDPQDLERELRDKFGQDAVIRVDGFIGRIPPKSHIASIRVVRSSFDAEYHKLGVTIIDITTKSGVGSWNGSLSFNFNDEGLNAKNPLSLKKLPSQERRFSLFLSGPLIRNKNSLFVSVSGNDSYRQNNIEAVTPSRTVAESVRNSTSSINPWIKFSQNLSSDHFLGVTYQGRIRRSSNDGVGGLNLPERAYSSRSSNNVLRLSENGNIGSKFYNEFRLQINRDSNETIPETSKVTSIVLDAFNNGGAGNTIKNRHTGVRIADNLLFSIGKINALKVGGVFEFRNVDDKFGINQNGTFIYPNIEAFTQGMPLQFTQRTGERVVTFSQKQLGVFVQDDIRVRKNLLISFGLRYEWQNSLKDYNNFSPRIGFAWSLDKLGKTTIRGGAGIYYNWLDASILSAILSRGESQVSETVVINPGFPNPFSNGSRVELPRSYWQKANDIKNPYIFLGSVGLQRRINRRTSLRVLYKFEKGFHLLRSRDLNVPIGGERPIPTIGRLAQVESSALSLSNSLNVGVNGKFGKAFTYGFDYTLSKLVSDSDGVFDLPSDSNNLVLDRAVDNLDQRHKLYLSMFWRAHKAITFSSIFRARSPSPYNLTTGFDNNGDTIFNDRPFGVSRNSERGTWQKQLDLSLSWTIGILKREGKARFPGTIVTTSAEAKSGDLGISANHRFSLKLYCSASNVLNNKNYNNFVGVQSSPLFGKPITASNPRRLDLGLKFSF